ncbi:hypothetical protein ACWD1W_28030 [Streptomyces olivaceoviridis]
MGLVPTLRPAPLPAAIGPLLAVVRHVQPAGPPDPRAAEHPVPIKRTVTLTEDLLDEGFGGRRRR